MKLSVTWQVEQTPSAGVCGFLWQSSQAANFAIRYSPFVLWQLWQGVVACLPVSGYFVVAWLNVFFVSLKATFVAWQVWHVAPSVPLWTSLWQAAHAVERPRYERVLWQALQSSGAWRPSRAKPVSPLWSKPFGLKWRRSPSTPTCSMWQLAQSFLTSRWTPFFALMRSATGLWQARQSAAVTCRPGSWHFWHWSRPSSFEWGFASLPGETRLPRPCARADGVRARAATIEASPRMRLLTSVLRTRCMSEAGRARGRGPPRNEDRPGEQRALPLAASGSARIPMSSIPLRKKDLFGKKACPNQKSGE